MTQEPRLLPYCDAIMFNIYLDVISEGKVRCVKVYWIPNPLSPEMTRTPLGELVICPHTDAKGLEIVISG